jgi:uncharacterized membrane protein
VTRIVRALGSLLIGVSKPIDIYLSCSIMLAAVDSPFLQADGLLRYIGLFLSGVCHQLPEHSIHLAGIQLPLCARCTGTYAGAFLGLANLWLRDRILASRMPPPRILALQGLFFVFWAIDGINSYVQFLGYVPGLYVPSQPVRLVAGMLQGLSLSLLVVPMFNFTFWRDPRRQRIMHSFRDLGSILVQLAAVVLLLEADLPAMYYPLLLIESLSVLLLLTIVNSTIIIILLRRENSAEHWSRILFPLILGLSLSMVEAGGLAMLRYRLGSRLA